jgi:hypothetical protein
VGSSKSHESTLALGGKTASDKKCDFNGIGCNKVVEAGSPSAFFTYLTFSYTKLFSVDKTENNGVYNTIQSIKNYACMPLPMYGKLFIFIIAVIAFAATTIDAPTAFGQNQTSNLTTLSTQINNTMTTANITTTAPPPPPPNMTLDDAREQYLSIWNKTEFNATFSTFIEPFSAAGYGVYEERNNVFAPGETIVLYVEPVGFDHRQILDEEGNSNNDTLYLINITADYEIASANGTEFQLLEDVPVINITSHRPNTEMSLTLTLTQDYPSIPTGNYIITYSVTDEVSGESFQLEKEIIVAENMVVSSNLA